MPTAGDSMGIDSGSGTLIVTDRTDTRIAGTFEAQLSGTDQNGGAVTVQVSGRFDSGAPAGPRQAPRGSPIPAMFGIPGN
jgi:hypothetical protein